MKTLLTILFAVIMSSAIAQTTPPVPVATKVTLSPGNAGDDDPGDRIISYFWKQVSGPATPTIVTPALGTTEVTGYNTPGVYVYELTVTDTRGATGKGTTRVTVLAANTPPYARPVSEITIQLPVPAK